MPKEIIVSIIMLIAITTWFVLDTVKQTRRKNSTSEMGGSAMPDVTREHELETLIVDLCDGTFRNWRDIQYNTGLSEERCKEMVALIDDVFKRYFERNKL